MNTTKIVLLVIFLAVFLVPVFAFFRMGWRILRGKDEFITGGSMGHQMTDPVEHTHAFRRLLRRLTRRGATTS